MDEPFFDLKMGLRWAGVRANLDAKELEAHHFLPLWVCWLKSVTFFRRVAEFAHCLF